MSDIRVMETIAEPGNMSRYGIEDGRSFAWAVGVSPTTPFIPPQSGETTAARFIQSNVGQDWWFDFYLNVLELGYFSRMFNFHTIAGYPEWFCGGATSPVAMDLLPIGELDAGTDGTNGKQTHTRPCYQFQVWGGGTWNPSDQCFHGIPKAYYQHEINIGDWHYVRGHINPQADATGYLTVWIDGTLWFDKQNWPIHWPVVPGLVGNNSGMDLFEGLYEAVDVPSAGSPRNATLLQRRSRIRHTISRWGHTTGAMLADTPTWRTHDSSIIVPGVGTSASRVFDTGTTIPDTGGGGGGGQPPTAPVNTEAPRITGTPQQGGVLSVNSGSWNGSLPITFGFAWYTTVDNGVTLVNVGSGSTYIPVAGDVGKRILLIVSATNAAGGPITSRSSLTVVIAPQGTQNVILIGKTTIPLPPVDGAFVGPDRKRGNSFYLPKPGRLIAMYCRLDGLAATTGNGLARLALVSDNGPGFPGFTIAVTSDITIPAGSQPANIQFAPTTTPDCLPGNYWLVCHTGGDPVLRAWIDSGIGLLEYATDIFADGTDYTSTWAVGDGVLTIWATFAPLAYPVLSQTETHGGSTFNVFHGNDGGLVSYLALDALANDTARGAACDAVNPSRIHTVHQFAASYYAFYPRIPSAPPPPTGWWN